MFKIVKTVNQVDPEAVLLKEIIGQGTFGAVHKGEWRGTVVAIKRITLPPEWQDDSWVSVKELKIWRYTTNNSMIILTLKFATFSTNSFEPNYGFST